MLNRSTAVLLLLGAILLATVHPAIVRGQTSDGGLTVHEWGTFTTVAGRSGRAIDWLPLGGPTDLPCFVEYYRNRLIKIVLTEEDPDPLDYETARARLWGKVRMETPVIYFYAPRELTASVSVQFPRGVITEWYPGATVRQPTVDEASLHNPAQMSSIVWPAVTIAPGTSPYFPKGQGSSHYYAARETDAAPIHANGQDERFLFYRGVAGFDVPLTAEAATEGSVRVRNLGREALPAVLLFENRGGAIGYRLHGRLDAEATIAAPALDARFSSLRADLERLLVKAGLFPREAAAMVETWRDSWFEEGTRVLYVLPSSAVDAILPLTITPPPAKIARVFVGRMEVITPALERGVKQAIARSDQAALERYGRFLGPVADRLVITAEPRERARIRAAANAAFAAYLSRAGRCQ